MTPAEAQMLLGIAASFDNRKPSEEAATAWAVALDGADFADCRTAIVNYYRTKREWLMPSDVLEGVVTIRRKRLDDYGLISPPDDLDPDDPEAYSVWYSTTMRAIASGQKVRGDEPEAIYPKRDLAELGINVDREPQRLKNPQVLADVSGPVAHLRTLRDEATQPRETEPERTADA